jgi:hypothetical protein
VSGVADFHFEQKQVEAQREALASATTTIASSTKPTVSRKRGAERIWSFRQPAADQPQV